MSGQGTGAGAQSIDPKALFAPVATIEKYLEQTLAKSRGYLPPALQDAIEYAVLGGGKRLRPLLTWYCCEAAGAPGNASLPAGAAVEFVHAFSLVHDDLPALDNDDLRRGKPTLHKHAGEAMAILAGDALLNLAYTHLSHAVRTSSIKNDLIGTLAPATGQMIAGQVRDTLGGVGSTQSQQELLQQVHREKTGALISAACVMGHLSGYGWCETIGGRSPDRLRPLQDQLKTIHQYSQAIGLIFQIVDDLIDVEQPPEKAGKPTGKDASAGKLTYPSVLGVEASREEVNRLRVHALQAIKPLGPPAQPLRDLCEYLCVRTQ